MRSQLRGVAIVVLVLFSSVSCSVTASTGSDSSPDEGVFLDALSGPIRDKYSDSVLLAEGRKVCDAFAQGRNEDEVETMISTDLGVDSGQFIGAVYGGLRCFPASHPDHGGK